MADNSGVRVEFDVGKITQKLNSAREKANSILVNEVVKDSNYYIPYDEGELMRSAIRSSDYANGKAIWDTPYAARLYHNPQYNFNTAGDWKSDGTGNPRWSAGNPHAQGLWFEAAKVENKEKWRNIADKVFKEGI